MAKAQYKEQIQYTNSSVVVGSELLPLPSKRVTYIRYSKDQFQFDQGYRQGLVFVLEDNVDKKAAAANLRSAIPATLSNKVAIKDYAGNPLLRRLEIMASNDVELLRKEK